MWVFKFSFNKTKKYPFSLSTSIGYYQANQNDDFEFAINQADALMYQIKKEKKAQRWSSLESFSYLLISINIFLILIKASSIFSFDEAKEILIKLFKPFPKPLAGTTATP